MTDRITAAIRADATTSDAEGRAQANEMVTAAVIERLAETVTRLNASEDRALRTRRDLIEANQSRNIAIADLNATRERLTTAEAFRDSLQAEADGLRSTVSDMHESWMRKVDAVTAERDAARVEAAGLRIERDAARFACATADEAIAELRARPGLDGDAEQLRCDLQSCRDENSTLIDRIAKVRAEAKRASDGRDAFCEAVMAALGSEDSTADVLASIETLKSERSQFKAEVDKLRARPVLTEERLAEALHSLDLLHEPIRSVASAKMMAKLGAVTLPAQDRAEELAAKIASAIGAAANGAWLASKQATSRAEESGDIVLGGGFAGYVSAALASLGATATTPSKPADVFAGVDHADLACTAAAAHKACTDGGPWMAAIYAVLDALRVKLVAPVDPEEVARVALDPVETATRVGEWKTSVKNVRATLTAKGIPVTPEAGK